MTKIFCPNCDALILDDSTCHNCGWQRATLKEEVGSEIWTTDLGTKLNKPHCYPVVAGNQYCVGTEDGTLIALDVQTGEIAWEHSLRQSVMAHAIATDGVRIFVGGEDVSPIPSAGKHLLALDAATGDVRWRCPTEAHSLSAAAVENGVVYFTATDDHLYAVDAASGEERWRVEHVSWGPAPPVVSEDVVCAGGRDMTLYAYDVAQGTRRWKFSAKNWFAHPLCVEGQRLFALAWDGHLYVLDLHSGQLLWEGVGERRRGFTTPPAAGKDRVYLGSRVYVQEGEERHRGYALVAFSAENGEERWRYPTEKHIFTPPLVAEDQVYFGANNGVLYAVDGRTGEAQWNLSVTSRAVTQPQLVGNLVIFGGRDGMIHAVQWQVPRVEVLTPNDYLSQERFVEAAAAYALSGRLEEAAGLYENELGDWQKAVKLYRRAGELETAAGLLAKNEQSRASAQLYEEAGKYEEAARLWEELGELRRARDLFDQSGNRYGYARVLESLREYLSAARVMQELEEYAEAARLFHLGGDRVREVRIYLEYLNEKNKAFAILRTLDEWEKKVEIYLQAGEKEKAAKVLVQHQEFARAANLFEESGALEESLDLRVKLREWEKVALIAENLERFGQAAEAWQRLGETKKAAEAYIAAAKQESAKDNPDKERLAALYEEAGRLYESLFEEKMALACLRMVKKYRHLPDLAVSVKAQGEFIEYQYNVLDLTIDNRGFGVALDINVQFEGEFDVSGDCCLRGLATDRSRELSMSVRPHRDQYGPSVPLKIIVSYRDRDRNPYEIQETVRIAVNPERSLEQLFGSTPLSINIGEIYQPGSRKVGGDSFEGGSIQAGGDVLSGEAQKGDRVEDRVEINRETRMGSAASTSHVAAGEDDRGPKVTRRDAGPVRRCPICNVPTNDPEQRYCADCGAPLPSPDVKEDV